MDETKRKEALERMKKALQEGRAERKQELDFAARSIDGLDNEARRTKDPTKREEYKEMLKQDIARAEACGLLEKVRIENRYGEESKALAVVKDREAYQKRPSVRAMTTEQTPRTKLNLVGNRLNTAIDNRLRKETPEAIDMAVHGRLMPETKARLQYEVYLNKDPMATVNGYRNGDKCQRVRVGKLLQGVSNEKHLAGILGQYNSPRYNTPETMAKIKRSISVGDVIRIGKEAYAVEKVGFRKLDSFRMCSEANEKNVGRSM